VETFKASDLPAQNKAAGLHELYASRLDTADLTPANEEFDTEIQLGDLGPIRIVRMSSERRRSDRSGIDHKQHLDHAGHRQYSFVLQTRGSSVLAHYGHEAILGEGDIILCNSAAPHAYRVDESSEVVMLRVPCDVLKEHLPSPDYFCGRHLAAAEGLTGAITALTMGLCARLESGLTRDFQDRIAGHLLDMIATSYAIAFDSKIGASSSIVEGLYAKVKLYIEQNLRDPDLSPCSIADKLKLSSRYLRMVFATGSETASAYILRRRLEECARQISDPSWRGHSITQIAFAWGFNSAPHFSRSFRARYSVSPRHYRRVQLDNKRTQRRTTQSAATT
jgi:AraC family transcriptional regulator, positive regulator of tynA and feaB